MSITIGGLGSSVGAASAGAAPAAADVSTAVQAQVDSSQSAEVNALFGSLGLGTHTNTLA